MANRLQISSTLMACTGQTAVQDSQPVQYMGLHTRNSPSSSSMTFLGQIRAQARQQVHFSSFITGMYISALLSGALGSPTLFHSAELIPDQTGLCSTRCSFTELGSVDSNIFVRNSCLCVSMQFLDSATLRLHRTAAYCHGDRPCRAIERTFATP
jgi:hypothetical protein